MEIPIAVVVICFVLAGHGLSWWRTTETLVFIRPHGLRRGLWILWGRSMLMDHEEGLKMVPAEVILMAVRSVLWLDVISKELGLEMVKSQPSLVWLGSVDDL